MKWYMNGEPAVSYMFVSAMWGLTVQRGSVRGY